MIFRQFDFNENVIIIIAKKLLKRGPQDLFNLKKGSYIIWRKRVRGRISKHRKKTKAELKYYEL